MSTENKTIVTDGIKSQDRVKQHGEVFTPVHIVKDMTGLVNKALNEKLDEQNITDEAQRNEELLKKTWLEPACGTGNFLIEILNNKLSYIRFTPELMQNIDKNVLVAVSTIYGIDIQSDNVKESRARLIDTPAPTDVENGYETVTAWYKRMTGKDMDAKLLDSIKFIADKNIIHGDALTGLYYEDTKKMNTKTGEMETVGVATATPMRITEWKFKGNQCQLDEVSFNSMKDGSTGVSVQDYNNKYFDIYNLRACENAAVADDDIGEMF